MTHALPPDLAAAVRAGLDEWRSGDRVRRLWLRDASLWTGSGEDGWLGWLDVIDSQARRARDLEAFARRVREDGTTHVLLLGMGGSSLGPEVLAATLGSAAGLPTLIVLDSTDPAQIRTAGERLDPRRTLHVVSSKSGTTLETRLLERYFMDRARRALGAAPAARRFVAITDPGSALEEEAAAEGFLRVFHGIPSIGGRYSALSDFGLLPAALIGLDVADLLERAASMARRCGPDAPPAENPGVVLGLTLGELARRGRDKVTLFASRGIRAFGSWLEQLLAESTGKSGRGLIPVDLEEAAAPRAYGEDRVFVHLRLESDPDPALDRAVEDLRAAGQPVLSISLASPRDLAAEFFRWEVATAVAGSVLRVNPFDQPDVEAAKAAARALTEAYEAGGPLAEEPPLVEENGVRLFADPRNAAALRERAGAGGSVEDHLAAHVARLGPGDYFAALAWVERSDAHAAPLQALRHAVRDARRVATCLGFGPRYLHSTGQAYKGGPGSGVFLLITGNDAADLPVPGQRATFGVVKAAQARGDLAVLAQRGRRVLRAHLGGDAAPELERLSRIVRRAAERAAR